MSDANPRWSSVSGVSYEEIGFDDPSSSPWSAPPPPSVLPPSHPVPASGSGRATYSPSLRDPSTPSLGVGSAPEGQYFVGDQLPSQLAYSPITRTTTNTQSEGQIVVGVALVDFNHLIGPTVEFAYPPSLQIAIREDESLSKILPFLALPDGAHLSEEDYSYFHCTYKPKDGDDEDIDVPANTTLFGISCNRQIASADLLKKTSDVTRSMVQKAVVVIASQPVFGPIRDRLGVVTRAFFAQRDFTQMDILEDFYTSLEASLQDKSGENAIYMGTSLRELVHKFRHKTLILLKLLMLQKRIMLFGYPVEKLCTYQYSLISLMPGLLMSLRDCGDPELDIRKTKARPTSLRTSDRGSLLRYMGLPLHVFGKDAFFQPYLPLQQMDLLYAKSWLVGTTNQIVTQQKECKYDLLVNIDNNTFEFADPKTERLVALTAADRKWMDDIVKTVEDSWNTPEGERAEFQGSDDDLRARFEEYICAALSSVKYADFITKGKASDIAIVGVGGEANPLSSFSEAWAASFRSTAAYELWDACTDPVLFDLCEPRHPCDGKVNAVSDIGIRLAEGLHDLRIDEHLGPTRDAVASAFAAGSSSLFRAFDGVRNEVSSRLEAERARRAQQAQAPGSKSPQLSAQRPPSTSTTSSIATGTATPPSTSLSFFPSASPGAGGGVSGGGSGSQIADIRNTLGGIGSGIGSFFGSRVASFSAPRTGEGSAAAGTGGSGAGSGAGGGMAASGKASPSGLRPMSLSTSATVRTTSGQKR